MRRSTVLSLPLKSVFPDGALKKAGGCTDPILRSVYTSDKNSPTRFQF